MSSESFENREDDFRTSFEQLERKVGRLSMCSGENRNKLCRDIDRDVEDCTVLLQEMEQEAKRAPPTFRLDMVSKVRKYRGEVEQMAQSTQRTTKSEHLNMHATTGGFFDDDFSTAEQSQRTRLLGGTESLNRASDSLARTHRIAAETDEVGAEIITELGGQRESLVRTRDRLHDTDANLSKSKGILNTMGKRVITNKLILAVIICLELGILGGVVYWKFFT